MTTKQKIKKWKKSFLNKKKHLFFSLTLLITALTLQIITGNYTNVKANVSEVTDLLLDNLPVIDLNIIFVWLFIIMIGILIFYPLFFHPKKFPYFLNLFSSLMIIRAFFIILTHLKTPAKAIVPRFPILAENLFVNNDSFFSGHTAMAFLGFLMFRKHNKILGYFFLISSFLLGASSLLMHRHYSIDVFAAFFITYGTYKMGNYLFKKNRY